jgi:hypothetical protein
MSKVRDMAQKILEAEKGYKPSIYYPFWPKPRLDDMWPVEQEKYIRMAEAALIRDEPR